MVTHDFLQSLSYCTRLKAEHRRLDLMLDEILEMCHTTEVGPIHFQLAEKVAALRNDLAHHFAEEEDGGCLEEAISRQPSLSADVTKLEDEHRALLAMLDEFLVNLRRAESGGTPEFDLATAFHSIAQSLRAHEASENQIMATAFGIELQ